MTIPRASIALALLLAVVPLSAQEPVDSLTPEEEEMFAGELLPETPEPSAEDVQEPEAVALEAGERAGDPAQDQAGEPGEEPEEPFDLPGLPGVDRRISFEVPFSAATGGGSARGSARDLEYLRQDYVVALGGVEVAHGDLKFQGDRVEIDLATKIVTARGNVILDQGPKRITAETMVYDITSQTGKFTEAAAYVDPDIYFRGADIEKTGENVYELRDGVVTSCSGDVPVWSFKSGNIRINTEGYTRVRNTTMRIKRLPILYTPYMLYPSNQERKSGFLFPNIGYSDRRGYLLGLAYYQTMGDSVDATLYADVYGQNFLGLGAELRYEPTAGSGGIFEGYTIDDPIRDDTRWKATLTHESNDLPAGLRGVVRIIQVSDFDYFRDFERDFSQIALRRLQSSAYLSGNWGSHSFNFTLDELEYLIRPGETQIQRQLPEVKYVLRPTKVFGLPIYLDLESSASYLQAERAGTETVDYGRADLAPRLSVPLSYWPWLSVKVTAGGRLTYYDDSLTADRKALSGDSLTRTFPFGEVSVIGPSFSRVYEKKIGSFGKFKHIVEPRLTYDFLGDPSGQELAPRFDSIDDVRKQSIVTYSLVNRLLAKPADEDSLLGAREILAFEISRAFSLNQDQPFQQSKDRSLSSRHSRIGMRFRYTPSLRTNFEVRSTYSTLFPGFDTASISGNTAIGRHQVGLTWFTRKDVEADNTTSHQARVYTSIELVPARLRYGVQANYDFVTRILQSHRHRLEFFGQCFGLLLEFRQVMTTAVDDKEIRVAISLKNIGTFLDLNGGSRQTDY